MPPPLRPAQARETDETPTRRYRRTINEIREERGLICEACGEPARHGHHMIPVTETSIHSELVYDKGNILLLCDNCHSLMHPRLRNIDWKRAKRDRGQGLRRR